MLLGGRSGDRKKKTSKCSLSASFSHLLKSSTRYSISCSAIFMALAASALLAMASGECEEREKKREGEERGLLRIESEAASEREKKNEKKTLCSHSFSFVQSSPSLSLARSPSSPLPHSPACLADDGPNGTTSNS